MHSEYDSILNFPNVVEFDIHGGVAMCELVLDNLLQALQIFLNRAMFAGMRPATSAP